MFCFQIGLNSSNYLWIVTQSVVGNINDKMAGRDQSWSPDFRGISFTMENFKDPSCFMATLLVKKKKMLIPIIVLAS